MSPRGIWPALALAAILAGACVTGMPEETYARRYGAFGAMTEVRTRGGRVVIGELLSIGDSGVTLMEKQRVVVVQFGAVRTISIERLSVDAGHALWSARFRREASLRARYPHGITPDLMSRLLTRSGQQAVDSVPGPAR